MRLLVGIAVAALVLPTPSARAGGGKDPDRGGESDAVQAMLDCQIGGKALSPLRPNVIGGHVVCAIVFDGFSVEGLGAEAWIEQGGVESAHHLGAAVPAGEEGDDALRFDPFVRGVDVRACRDFIVHARIRLDDAVVWATDLAVAAKCKKAKKIAAKLSCSFVAADATVYTWPGTGAKQKPRLDDTLACWLRGPKTGAAGFVATIGGHDEPLWQDDDTGVWSSAQMLDPDLDFTTCEAFAVVASIANADGQVVWAGKQAIAQRCP